MQEGTLFGRRLPLTAGGLVTLLLLAAIPAVPAVPGPAIPALGMDVGSLDALEAAGTPPTFASYWVGSWTANSGWTGLDNAMRQARAYGVTPVVYWYYWGDSISSSCIENGCDGKSQAQWYDMTATIRDRVRAGMGGERIIIVLENEFNKGDITGWYAPTFDAKLERIANDLNSVPGVELVLGFGAWGEKEWNKFPRAIAATDMIGFQMMRGSTRDSEATYRNAPERISYYIDQAIAAGSPGTFLYDLALSSYQGSYWENVQKETLQAILSRWTDYSAAGLHGIMYRSLKDTYMDPSNYYREAESHWGLKRIDGTNKPAWNVWRDIYANPPAPPEPNVPATWEAESMQTTTGKRVDDATASGGALWNLWANGDARKTISVAQPARMRVVVDAKGQSAGGVDAQMRILVGGDVVKTFSVAPDAIRAYEAEFDLMPATVLLQVAFINDAVVNREDRNLLLDRVRVEPGGNRAPLAAIGATMDGYTGTFDATGSRDPDANPLTYAWDFGDGTGSTDAVARHAYAGPGEYLVTLTVNDGQAVATATRSVRANLAPNATFLSTTDWLTVRFDAAGSRDPEGSALAYAWDFGDGTTGSGAQAARTYAAGGMYTVTLTVTDAGGASGKSVQQVGAIQPNRAPSANIGGNGRELTWTFDGAGSTDPDGDALTYAWDFGDGTTGSGVAPTKVYPKPGSYTVKLTVTDPSGLSGTTTRTIPVEDFRATFAPKAGNSWWVETKVSGNTDVKSVCAKVNGGACQALQLKSWGAWAASFHVPDGSRVEFVATSVTGRTATSVQYHWPSATPYMTATFTPYEGGNWWVQTKVSSNQDVQSVCASVNGGACQPLTLRSWGAWAASFHVPNGAKVKFTATSTLGQTVTSSAYVWPVK